MTKLPKNSCLVLLCVGCFVSARAFMPAPTDVSVFQSNEVRLFAKKSRKGNKKAPVGGGFGGFGSTADASEDLSSKLRSVPGQHAGAGSKVLRKAANTFDALRKEHGAENCFDVYLRSPLNSPTIFWFVGKVAIDPNSSATSQAAVLAQKRLILEYAKTQLRPQNFGGKYASQLDLWLAPGDSEMNVVRNMVDLEPVRGSASDLPEGFDVSTVGFNPEIYIGDEVRDGGLRVERSEEGKVTKPVFDINQSA